MKPQCPARRARFLRVKSKKFLSRIRSPEVLGELKHLLGLPDVAKSLQQIEETLGHIDHRIDGLSDAISRFTDAQARTEQAVKALADAQARTDQTVERLSGKGEELTTAQTRTEATLERFIEKTDRSIAELLAGQDLTEATLERFMAASEKSLGAVRQELGALAQTTGIDVEDIVSADLPDWLERHHHIRVRLQCPYFLSELGDEELAGFGEGQGSDGKVTILAEAKDRVRIREVEAFWAKAERVRAVVQGAIFPVLIGRATYPDAKARAEELGLTLVSTSALRR